MKRLVLLTATLMVGGCAPDNPLANSGTPITIVDAGNLTTSTDSDTDEFHCEYIEDSARGLVEKVCWRGEGDSDSASDGGICWYLVTYYCSNGSCVKVGEELLYCEPDGGSENNCTSDQINIAEEYTDMTLYTGGGSWPCGKFVDAHDATGTTGVHNHSTGFLHDRYKVGKNRLIGFTDHRGYTGTHIESSWRCPQGNQDAGSTSTRSQHMEGTAGDFHNPKLRDGSESDRRAAYNEFVNGANYANAGWWYKWDTGPTQQQVKVRRFIHVDWRAS